MVYVFANTHANPLRHTLRAPRLQHATDIFLLPYPSRPPGIIQGIRINWK